MGEKQNQPFQLAFNASLKIDSQGSRVTSDGGLIRTTKGWRFGLYCNEIWKSDGNSGLASDCAVFDLGGEHAGAPSSARCVACRGGLPG